MPNYNTLLEARDWVGMRGFGGEGGRRSGPHRKSHVIWVNLDLNPLPPLKKFPGSAHWDWGGGGNLFHWNALIRTDCLMKDQALYQLVPWDWLKMMAFTWLRQYHEIL